MWHGVGSCGRVWAIGKGGGAYDICLGGYGRGKGGGMWQGVQSCSRGWGYVTRDSAIWQGEGGVAMWQV